MNSVQSVLDTASTQLSAYEQPRLEAEYILAYVLNKNRAFLRAFSETNLNEVQLTRFNDLLAKRILGVPFAYLIEQKTFWDITLKVTPDVLIPRPETELIVEQVLALYPHNEKIRLVDLGTGSGAIALAIANEKPAWSVVATDKSSAALAIATENRQSLKINNVRLLQSDWFSALAGQTFDVVVSNPPYIAHGCPHLEENVKTYEPTLALLACDEGMADIKQIVAQAVPFLSAQGWLMLEHGWQQAEKVQALFSQQGYEHIQTLNDLSGLQRVTLGQRPAAY
jgi:release factor glutamine methyltransferase